MSADPSRSHTRQSSASPAHPERELAAALQRIEECEQALAESEARFRNIIDNNGDGIVIIAGDGTILYANSAAGRMFGKAPAVLRGTHFGFPLSTKETAEIEIVGNGRVIGTAEMRVTESMWDGAPVCLASLRDVTDREALRRERAAQLAASMAGDRLREIISQAPVAIAVLSGPEHRYDIANHRYLSLIGNRDVIGKPVREALPELAGQGIYELLDTVYRTGEPFIGTEVALTIEREGGKEEAVFTFVYHPLRTPSGISGIAVVASDVTAQVRARQEVEEANRAKSEFLATMSHELRTPLNAIGGYADLILAGIRGPVTEPQRIDLERIKRSQRHLLGVINDILNFAKLESGRVPIRPVDISMNAVLGEIESLVSPMLIEKGIRYDYRCCDPKYQAHADPERLQQVLLNLLSNAAKFTGNGGTITVECLPTKTAMVVEVRDTGIGIPPEKLESIFEPFVQLDRGKAPELAGTGLGLSISRDLARAMKGDLSARSEPGHGATFVLTLPRAKNAAPEGGDPTENKRG